MISAEDVLSVVHQRPPRVLWPPPPPRQAAERASLSGGPGASPPPGDAAALPAPGEVEGGEGSPRGALPPHRHGGRGAGGAGVSEHFFLHLSIATRPDSRAASKQARIDGTGHRKRRHTTGKQMEQREQYITGIFPGQRWLDLDYAVGFSGAGTCSQWHLSGSFGRGRWQ